MSFLRGQESIQKLDPRVKPEDDSREAFYFMKKIVFNLLLLVFFLFTFFFFPTQSFAAENFTTDYNVTYEATDTGITHAILKITLTNTSSQYFASSYKVKLGFDDISNVQASDPDGPINPTIEKTDDGYAIGVVFNRKSVGLGSKMTFTISFDTPTIAKKYGNVWEVNIPGISNTEDFENFTVAVKTPPSFGKPAYIKPKQPSNSMTFTKEQLGNSGISIAFGDKQVYDFQLTYHLQNANVLPTTQEIALPPTTNYQEVAITDISPKPRNVRIDEDGNWLAEYTLTPFQKLDITARGQAEVLLTPRQQEISPQEREAYLKPQGYWEIADPAIQALARELKTPQAIYHYVANTLKYDFERVTKNEPRLGAVGALSQQDSAVCREFTDLFIAIARAAGIPARQVEGYAHTENARQRPLSLVQDILHSWPEYYDSQKRTWVMVDPTWASTTGGVDYFSVLDFDHLTFVIKGRDSGEPVPAGGYKLANNKNNKDVKVIFADTFARQEPDFSIQTSFGDPSVAGLPIRGEVTVINTSTALLPAKVMAISTLALTPKEQVYSVSAIPPYGHQDVDVVFDATRFLDSTIDAFSIRLGGETAEKRVSVAPIYLTKEGIGGVVLFIGIVTLLVFLRKKPGKKS